MYDDPSGHRYVKRFMGSGVFVEDWVDETTYVYVNGQEIKGTLKKDGKVVAGHTALLNAYLGINDTVIKNSKQQASVYYAAKNLPDEDVSVRDFLTSYGGMDNSEIGFYNTNGVYSVYTGADLARYNASKDKEAMEKVFPGMYAWINNENSSSENIFNNSISLASIGSFGEATRSYLHGVSTAIVQDYTYGLAPEASIFSTDVINYPEAYYKGKNMGHNFTTVASLIEGGIGGSATVGGAETVVLSAAGTVVVAHASTVLVSSQANRLKDQIMFASISNPSGTSGLGNTNVTGRTPHRTKPRIEQGNLKEGWEHIDSRHVTGNHPNGAGDLFESGTTRAQLEEAANTLIKKGTRISDPSLRLQTFEKVIKVNGKRDLVRVIVDADDANRVITIFPVRGGR